MVKQVIVNRFLVQSYKIPASTFDSESGTPATDDEIEDYEAKMPLTEAIEFAEDNTAILGVTVYIVEEENNAVPSNSEGQSVVRGEEGGDRTD